MENSFSVKREGNEEGSNLEKKGNSLPKKDIFLLHIVKVFLPICHETDGVVLG